MWQRQVTGLKGRVELEGSHKDHAQDSPRTHTLCLRALNKCSLSCARLAAVSTALGSLRFSSAESQSSSWCLCWSPHCLQRKLTPQRRSASTPLFYFCCIIPTCCCVSSHGECTQWKSRIALLYMHVVVIQEKLINWCQCRTETFWCFNCPPWRKANAANVSLVLWNVSFFCEKGCTKALLLSAQWPRNGKSSCMHSRENPKAIWGCPSYPASQFSVSMYKWSQESGAGDPRRGWHCQHFMLWMLPCWDCPSLFTGKVNRALSDTPVAS